MVAGGGFEPPTFGLCDLTHLSMRVGLYLHPRGMLAIQSLRLPPPFRGLGSVLPYRSRDVGFHRLRRVIFRCIAAPDAQFAKLDQEFQRTLGNPKEREVMSPIPPPKPDNHRQLSASK